MNITSSSYFLQEYNNTVISNETVRLLLSCVRLDNVKDTYGKIYSLVGDNIQKEPWASTRRLIISYLNTLYFSRDLVSDEFWFEMGDRLTKVCSVSIVLEGLNLKSFNMTSEPKTSNIPNCLVGIMDKLHSDEYKQMCNNFYMEHKNRIDNDSYMYESLYLGN